MTDPETVAGVEVSKPDKEILPARRHGRPVTKMQLADYYASVSSMILPHLADRPISMERLPDGLDDGGFYEKKAPSYFPDFVHRVRVDTTGGAQEQVTVANKRTLVYLADQACITPHTWLSRADALDHPDQLVFDLDPSVDGDIDGVRHATHAVGELLDELGLTAFVKTTGSRGYHVLVPLRPDEDFDAVRDFAQQAAHLLAGRDPDRLTVEQRKAKRETRVLIDVMRNGYAQTMAPAFAIRTRPGGTVSMPLEWDEVDTVEPGEFDLHSAQDRIRSGSNPWHGIGRHAQTLRSVREKLGRLSE